MEDRRRRIIRRGKHADAISPRVIGRRGGWVGGVGPRGAVPRGRLTGEGLDGNVGGEAQRTDVDDFLADLGSVGLEECATAYAVHVQAT